jgi:F0F1-type ATP synthase membrane subunit b/b'
MEALGINLQSLLIYLALFAGVYFIVVKFLIPPLSKSIDERAAFIEKVKKDRELLDQNVVKVSAQQKETEKEILKDSTEKANGVIEAAEKEADEIIKKANKDAKVIIADAQDAIEKKKVAIEKDFEMRVQKEVGELLAQMPEVSKKYSTSQIAELIQLKKNE